MQVSDETVDILERIRFSVHLLGEGISGQIFRGASIVILLKSINMGLTFCIAILLARFLGVEEYGIYAYAMSWVTLLSVFAKLGMDQVIVANVAVYHQNEDWAHIRGLQRFAFLAIGVAGLICSLAMAGFAWLMHRDEQALYMALSIACLLLPLRALLVPLGATLNGFRQITFAQLPLLLVIPATFLVLSASAYSLTTLAPSATSAFALQIIAVGAGLSIAIVLLQKGMMDAAPPQVLPQPRYQARAWLISALPMVVTSSMFIVNSNADIFMLGSLAGATQAGIYKAAARGAEMLTIGLVVISVPLGPIVARLYAAGEKGKLQHELHRWACIAFIPTTILSIFFIVHGECFLSLFGADFVTNKARTALSILTVGQLVHAAAGPAALLLVMTEHRNTTAWILTISAAANVGLNAVLIPEWGVEGAAIATASSTGGFALLLVKYAIQKTKLNPTVIPSFARRRVRQRTF